MPNRVLSKPTAVWSPPLLVACALLCAVLLIDGDVLFSPDHQPHEGDIALNALLIRDAADLQLGYGPYSRLGFHHPGPVSFYLLAAGARVLPLTPTPLGDQHLVQLLLSAALWMTVMGLHARLMRSTAAGLFHGLVLLAFLQAKVLAPGHMHPLWEFWGPLMTVLPTAVLMHAAVLAARGDRRMLPLMAACTVLMVHNHASMALIAGPLWLGAVAMELAAARRAGGRRPWGAYGWAAGILVLTSLPPLLEEWGAGTGNLTLMGRYLRDGAAWHHGPGVAAKAVWSMAWPPLLAWLPAGARSAAGTSAALWGGAAVILGLAGLRLRRAAAPERMLAGAAAAVLLLAVVWGCRMQDDPYLFRYLFHFVSAPLAVLATCALRAVVPGRWSARMSGERTAAALAIAGVVVVVLKFSPALERELPPEAGLVAALAADLPLEAGERWHIYLDRDSEDHDMWQLLAGTVLRLEQRGVAAKVPEAWDTLFGPHRTAPDSLSARTLVFTQRRAPADWTELWRRGGCGVFAVPGDRTFAEVGSRLR